MDAVPESIHDRTQAAYLVLKLHLDQLITADQARKAIARLLPELEL